MSDKGNVKVVARIRPQNQLESRRGGSNCVELISDTELQVAGDDGEFQFTFDRVLGPQSTQAETFECVAEPIVGDVLKGYNATIFAYGQTSSGKTFTMEGPSITDSTMRGIIPRTVSGLFQGVAAADTNLEFTVKVAYIEIYIERIRDLLDRYRTKVNLSVREDPRHGVYVAGVTEEYCTCEADLLNVMALGAANRATAATGMNEGSSRSHSVFMVTVTQRNLATHSTRSGKLFLVDLAGSEMVRKTNASGQQLEEAKTINKSLSALGLVINALTEERPAHVPYRDSKLTRVLQDSLGGNAKTALLINCSPSTYNANETLSTLRFGSRAKSIMNKPKINEQRSVEELSQLLHKAENAIDMQQSYILALEGQLRQGSGGNGGDDDDGGAVALQNKVAALSAELAEEREEARRVTGEAGKLTEILKEKEQLLLEAADLLRDAERHTEGLRAQAEAAEGERSQAVDEAQQANAALQEATMRFEFESSELAVRLETLAKANHKLAAEADSAEQVDQALPAAVKLGDTQMEDVRERFGEEAARFIADREEKWARYTTQAGAVGADAETAQSRISEDLQAACEKNMELEMTVAQLRETQGPEAEKLFSARERASLRMQKKFESLQQRLEQLVAVHRQLLRKYAALELEGAEDKKKIALRDERIVQLETNTRTLAMNMRTQAARHVVELTKLREQVTSVRQEQLEARVEPPDNNRTAGPATVIRGGASGSAPQPAVRAIRGGAQVARY